MAWVNNKYYQFPNGRYQEPSRYSSQESLKELFLKVVETKASDIFLQSGHPVIISEYDRLWPVTERHLDANEIYQMLNWLTASETSAALIQQGKEAVGRYSITHPDQRDTRGEKMRFNFRVNARAGMHLNSKSIQVALRSIASKVPTPEEVGLEPELVNAATNMVDGGLYCTGMTGSGKSTTFAAIMGRILTGNTSIKGNIFTLDRPIEYTFDTVDSEHSIVHQIEIGPNCESFAAGIESAMRHKPKLIVVGETRDRETMDAASAASESGHPMYTTKHVSDVQTIFSRGLSFYEPGVRDSMLFQLVNTARVLLHQKLIPSVDNKLVALRSYLILTDEMREEIIATADPRRISQVMKAMLFKHGVPRGVAAERLFIDGKITEAVYNEYKGK
jgi:defect-in-organelle-trafficking protein DotB